MTRKIRPVCHKRSNAKVAFKLGEREKLPGAELANVPDAVVNSGYPDFYQTLDKSTPLNAEQLKASNVIFNGLFNDLMLYGMDDMKTYDGVGDEPIAILLKHIIVDGREYSLSLKDKCASDPNNNSHGISFRDSEIITRYIDLQKIDERGDGREYWSYRLGVDGVIRRCDGGDITATKTGMIPKDATFEEIVRSAFSQLNRLTEKGLPNNRSEEDMGLNNQPVSPEEMLKLRNFLFNAADLDNPHY